MRGEATELVVCRTSAADLLPYDRLIGDAMAGDATLFAREDSVLAAWEIVDPVLRTPTPLRIYEPGSWGPAEADTMVASHGGWHAPCPGK